MGAAKAGLGSVLSISPLTLAKPWTCFSSPFKPPTLKAPVLKQTMGIFGVKPAQARSKDECKKPHYTVD